MTTNLEEAVMTKFRVPFKHFLEGTEVIMIKTSEDSHNLSFESNVKHPK